MIEVSTTLLADPDLPALERGEGRERDEGEKEGKREGEKEREKEGRKSGGEER